MPTRAKLVTRTETTSSNTTENLNKGTKLTFAEMDSNFIELQNQSIGIADDNSTVIDVTAGNTLTVAGTGGIQTSVSGQTLTIDASSITSSSLGDLTAIGSTLQSPSDADITLDPSGTGDIILNANSVTVGAGSGSGEIQLDAGTITMGGNLDVNQEDITSTSNHWVRLQPNGTGRTLVKNLSVGDDAGEDGLGDERINLDKNGTLLDLYRTNVLLGSTTTTGAAVRAGQYTTFTHSSDTNYFTFDQYGIANANNSNSTLLLSGAQRSQNTSDDLNKLQLYFKNVEMPNHNVTFTIGNEGNLTLQALSGTPRITLYESADDGKIEIMPKAGLGVNIDGLQINDNTISSYASNQDTEIDANGTGKVSLLAETNLNSNKIINLADPTSAQDAATKAYVDAAGGADLGNLQVNDTTLSPITTNDDLILTSNGTGNIVVQGITYDTSPSTPPGFTGTALKGGTIASQIEFTDNGTLYLRAGSNFSAKAGGGYDLNLYTDQKLRVVDSSGIVIGNTNIDASISTLTGGSLTLHTAENVNSGYIKINDTANQNIQIIPDGTGKIQLDNNYWPNTDGTAGQVLSTNGAGVLSFVTPSSTAPTTFVGDDSTGTAVTPGETFKIAGGSGITTAVSGDTLTITGPDLSSYITNSPITVVGDDSTGTTLNTGETLKVTGTGGLTAVVTGDTLTIDGSGVAGGGGSATGLTFVGDDSTGTLISDGETIKIAGGSGITTAMSGDTLTITATGGANTGDFTFTGNNISTTSSNADFEIGTSGTGAIVLRPRGGSVANAKTRYDNPSYYTGNVLYYENLNKTSGTREYGTSIITNIKTDGNNANSGNDRYRNYNLVTLDVNGSLLTSSSTYLSRQAHNAFESIVYNSASGGDAGSVANHAGIMVNPSAGINNTQTSSLLVSSMAGVSTTNDFIAGTDPAGTLSVPNSYNFYANGWAIDGNSKAQITVDNHYGVYIPNRYNSGDAQRNPTNIYAFVSDYKDARSKLGSLEQFQEHAVTATHSASGTYTVDATNNLHIVTLGADITSFTMSNFPTSSSKSTGVTLYLVQDGTGGRGITFTAGASETFKFANGVNSSSVTAANDIQVVYIFSRYNGSTNTYYWTIGPAYS